VVFHPARGSARLGEQGRDDLDDLVLLTARETLHLGEHVTDLAARIGGALRFVLAQQFLAWATSKDYTKLDWVVWTATLATNAGDFEKIVAPAWQFANDSASRVPLTDWYDTKTAKQQGFQARSVVGGLFIKMLADPAMWKKYSGR